MQFIVESLGTDRNGYSYILFSNNYVYQFLNTKCLGWFCSFPAWERTLHKITEIN